MKQEDKILQAIKQEKYMSGIRTYAILLTMILLAPPHQNSIHPWTDYFLIAGAIGCMLYFAYDGMVNT